MHDDSRPARDPAVVVAFSGWNDAGNAASDSVLYLLEKYPATEVARIDDEQYFDFQATRPQLNQAADGPWIQWPHVALMHLDHPDRDLYLLLGPEPNLRWRSFTAEVIAKFEELQPKLVLLLGALLSDTPHSRPLPVTTHALDSGLRERLMVEKSTYEGPVGIVGVLSHALNAARLPSASMWVSIPHYVSTPPSPKGQYALLAGLEQILEISLTDDSLVSEAGKWTKAVDELSQEDPDVAEYIGQLEEAKDASDVEGVTGETIAKELEKFLRRRKES